MSLEFKPGIYEHHKGPKYRALFKGRCSEQREIEMVAYVSLTPKEDGSVGAIWFRPYSKPLLEGDDCWTDLVTWPDGQMRPRFRYIGE